MQDQIPTQCDQCGAGVYKAGETRTEVIYRCLSHHTIRILKVVVQRIAVNGTREAA